MQAHYQSFRWRLRLSRSLIHCSITDNRQPINRPLLSNCICSGNSLALRHRQSVTGLTLSLLKPSRYRGSQPIFGATHVTRAQIYIDRKCLRYPCGCALKRPLPPRSDIPSLISPFGLFDANRGVSNVPFLSFC